MTLISFVPHRQIVHYTREETRFSNTKAAHTLAVCFQQERTDCSQESGREEARHVLRDTQQRCDDAPYDSQSRKPKFWRRALQHDVARKLEEHISDEVERQASEILIAGHGLSIGLLQIVKHALDSCVGN